MEFPELPEDLPEDAMPYYGVPEPDMQVLVAAATLCMLQNYNVPHDEIAHTLCEEKIEEQGGIKNLMSLINHIAESGAELYMAMMGKRLVKEAEDMLKEA